jgi:hypothetical protein
MIQGVLLVFKPSFHVSEVGCFPEYLRIYCDRHEQLYKLMQAVRGKVW